MAYPDDQLQEVGPVVKPVVNNLFKQRQAEQQKKLEEAKNSPVANNLQQVVDAYNFVPEGAVGHDNPAIQQSARMAQQYAPMLMGQQPKNTEQMMADRALKQTNNFKAPSMEVNPNDPSSGMNALASMYTSPEQEEKLRKTSLANQRILAVGNALRHIGNIYHTTKYAPSQQFNNPVLEEQARYEKGKALRDAANIRYMNYQQAKAAQDQKTKQWAADFELKIRDDKRKEKELEGRGALRDAQIERQKTLAALDQARQEGVISENKYKELRNKWFPEVQKATIRQKDASAAASRTRAANDTRRTTAYVNKQKSSGVGANGVAPLDTPRGQITPNGRSYSNQLLQMFDYAKSKGLVQESDVSKRLREMGFGKDQSDNVKRQMVMDLLRTNSSMGDYAAERLGWSYGGVNPSTNWDEYAEEEDDWNDYLED